MSHNINNDVPASSSSSALQPSSSSLLSVNQGESAVMIPLSAENLDTLRASGIQFSQSGLSAGGNNVNLEGNSGIASGGGNFNLSFSNGNVILNSGVDTGESGVILEAVNLAEHSHHHNHHHHQLLQLQQHQQQSLHAVSRSAGNNRNVMHSNDISSNSIIDGQCLGSVINMNNSDSIHIGEGSNSASGLIQALGAAVSRAVASGNFSSLFTSAMNLPLSMNQNGNEIITFNTVSPSVMNSASTQQQQHQLILNQIDANSMLSSLPSANLLSSSASAESSSHNLMSRGGNNVTQSSGIGNSSMVTVTIDQQQQQQQHMWVQPDQSSFLPSTINLASQGLSLQGAITLQSPTSSQDNSIQVQELQQSHINGNHFQDLRSQFPGVFQVSEQDNRAETYQSVMAHSTYGQDNISQDFRDAGEDSEATPSFSSAQQLSDNQVTVNAANQLVSAPVVDSSTLQQGYQFVYDAENRVITVQRVMSPSDCTVSQSSLSFESSEAQANLLPMGPQSGQSYTMVQVSTLQNPFGSGSSTNEVSTTSMASMLGGHRRSSSLAGSSIDDGLASSSFSHNAIIVPKIEVNL
ncbi:hypothetical protein Btru_064637 [Bulinus truncatus]|nr:hypothetical protein Btru_064637 [Bulinus truncatus]